MPKPRIYADFNGMVRLQNECCIILDCRGTFYDLNRLGLELKVGLEAVFYSDDVDMKGNPDDIEADGIVKFDEAQHGWVAVIDISKIRHASERLRDL